MIKKQFAIRVRKIFHAALMAALVLPAIDSQATTLDISPVPLYLGGAVEPNIMFTLDDSGSMYWSYMPDTISGDRTTKRAKAPEYNQMYYNPRVTYSPPVDAYGVSMDNASFSSGGGAWDDGYNKGTCKVNLATSYRPTWYYGNNCDNNNSSHEYAGGTEPAYYYRYYKNYNEDHPTSTLSRPPGCSDSINDDDCYVKVLVSSTSGVGGSDERTNFANWYSYYRRRVYTAKAAVGQAFASQGTGMRVGFGAINNSSTEIDGVSTRTLSRGVRHFDGTDREDFFNLLYGEAATGITPLRRAADDVGQYFSRSDDKGPWNETPGASGGADYTCRQSFHIIMSDGYWSTQNSYQASTAGARADNDSTDGPTIPATSLHKKFKFDNISPFFDGRGNTLADVAMYYWKRDLRTDMANDVPPNTQDPAFWQHVVTYTIGLGVTGTVDPDAAFNAIALNTDDDDTNNVTITWNNPFDTKAARIDDMLHAAVNSRGGFFSAKDPKTFKDALSKLLFELSDRTSSASSVALNSGSLFGGSFLFQARFNTRDWSGELLAYAIGSDGSVAGTESWKAADHIPAHGSRRILTYDDLSTPADSSRGKAFRWADLSTAQQTALGSAVVLDYIRGDQSNESPSGSLRHRDSLLGDIVNSAPLFVGPPGAGYPNYWGLSEPENSKPYTSFVAGKSSRTPMVFTGANDGMLHAFNATTGAELFAYVPNALMSTLPDLSVSGYTHKYYVDGSPVALDAFFNNSWHTVLAGGLNAGGQGIYALDITDAPSGSDTETGMSSRVLWEFTDADDADLGYTYSRPNIVRLANGVWAAVFGNGYNNTDSDGNVSSTGNAVLYLVNIETGALIRKIDTKAGSADDPTGSNRPNGLSSVAPVDVDGDYIVDYVYAGDLFGNLWKFDLSDTSESAWKVAYGTTAVPLPLFRAQADTSVAASAQPITVRPVVGRHPSGYGYMVYFGTGKYIEVGDNSTSGETTQTFYGVWDQDNSPSSWTVIDRDDLTSQEILTELDVSGYSYRVTTDTTPVYDDPRTSGLSTGTTLGWRLDLYNTNFGTATTNYGERQVTDPLLRGDRIIFTTLLPSDDPCTFGGSGWLMELEAGSGKRLPFSPFDTDHDGTFTSSDLMSVDVDGDGTPDAVASSGKKSKVGILPAPAVITDRPNDKEYKYESGSSGDIEVTTENPGPGASGRTSWLELINF